MPGAIIRGTGSAVPETVVTNQDLIDKYGIDTTHEWIVQRTGIEARRFAPAGVGTGDLGAEAAQKAIEAAGLKPHDLDMILLATLSPDMAFPGSGVIVQQKLGLCDGPNAKFVPCMDIRNQCSGFLYALATASSMVKSGAVKHVLVVGAETHSPALDLTTRGRTVSTLFGDGAGAVVVSACDDERRGVRRWNLGADGRYANVLCQRVWDVRQRPYVPLDADGNGVVSPDMLWAKMDGRQVFRHAVERMCSAALTACMENGITGDQVDLFLFHQANMRINEYVANTLGIPPEKLVHNIQRYGNTTAATIPLLMDEAVRDGRLKEGMKVVCVAFGSGFTWGAALIDW